MRSERDGNLRGFREPSENEKISVARYMENHYTSIIRSCHIASIIMLLLSLFLLAEGILNIYQAQGK